MRRELKILFIGIISLSVIITTYSVILLQKEESVNSNNGDNDTNELEELTSSPKGIRLTYIHNFSDSIVISWFTEKSASDSKAFYSLKSDLSDSIEIRPNVTLVSNTPLYSAELVNLLPNKTYYYQIRSDNNILREIMNFTTFANNPNHFRFLVYGDSRTGRNERSNLTKRIMESFKDSFDFTIHTGDIVNDGRLQEEWNNYFMDTEFINAFKQGVYVEGNHERGVNTRMYDNLLMPNNASNRYYSFTYGDMGFIILNSNSETVDDDIQTEWLNQTLIEFSQKNTFNFAFLHHPLLGSRSYPYHRDNWKPLFDKYNTTLIMCGHNHHYERSYPMINSSDLLDFDDSELYDYNNLNNSIYVVAGGAGAPLYPVYNDLFIAHANETYHFVIVDIKEEITETTLSLEAWGMPNDFNNLYLFDNITITKSH